MPPEIRRITETFLHNPVKVEVSKPASTAVTVSQSQVSVGREPHEKRAMLRQLLRDAKDLKNAIIFCNRKREVAQLYKSLQRHGFSVAALHGDMDQPARTAALDQFRKGELPLLVASDVAARGLDIPEVSHVFNFDVPHHPDDYVHRIGRTGRAGRLGTAITLVCPADQKSIAAVEKLIGQPIAHANVSHVPSDEEAAPAPARSRKRADTRKPRSERGERSESAREPGGRSESPRARGGRGKSRKPDEAAAVAAQPPSIGRVMAPSVAHDQHSEPADHSHLPAFLLRPVRARG
jgi:superfamily II DNA/RNA helicase